jgi:UDP-2-acetamido-3-amino-2,3-dideoxy-glucuronate N-acetyltransferase
MHQHIAVIGSGYWGKNLVRNYHDLGALSMICDQNETTLARYREQYPDIETCCALSDVLSADTIQGIAIATPAETHYALAREALLAGKHVYVEKPLVLHEAEGAELIALADEHNLTLMVGHLLQYHPAFIKLKTMVTGGDLGRINYIYSHRLNLGKIRREENILWSFAPHDISMILSLAGEEPESVLTTGGNYLHKKIADVTTTHLEFPSGLKAHIFVSWLHPFKVQQLIVVGEKSMIVFDDTQLWPDKLRLFPHEITWQNNMPIPARADPQRIEVVQAEPLRRECEQFLSCIARGDSPLTDGREGLRVLRVLNASQRSLDHEARKVYLAQGDSDRKELPGSFVHDTAIVDGDVEIGAGTRIWHFSHLLSGTRIGANCSIGQNVVIGPDVTIGNTCKIQNNVSIYTGVTLEDEVFCGPSMVFTNVYNPRSAIRRMHELRPTLVKKGATIGANATILCGVTIGSYAFIGTGAVVIADVPDYALVVGNPARQKGWMCACGVQLTFTHDRAVCAACKRIYRKQNPHRIMEQRKEDA